MNRSHSCREGEEIAVEWTSKYPRVITYCNRCRKRMREIPFDDAPLSWMPLVQEMVAYARRIGFHE